MLLCSEFLGWLVVEVLRVVCMFLRLSLWLVSVLGLIWMCMVGCWLLLMNIWFMLLSCEIFCVRMLLVVLNICVSGSVCDLIDRIRMGVLVGLIL